VNSVTGQAADNQRGESRLDEIATVFIEWLAGTQGLEGGDSSAVILCNSIDVSAHGLRVCIDRPLQPDAILTLGVELKSEAETLFLAAEVRWCTPAANTSGRYWVGFRVLNSTGSDDERWRDLVARLQGAGADDPLNGPPPVTATTNCHR
jgi:hypothetical protein